MNVPCLTLWYLGAPYAYEAKHLTDNVWRPTWDLVLRVPVCEMLSKTAPELAAELVQMSNDKTWIQRHKRPMRLGDRFAVDGVNWVFTPTRDIIALTAAGLPTLKLAIMPGCVYSDTTITQLPGPT